MWVAFRFDWVDTNDRSLGMSYGSTRGMGTDVSLYDMDIVFDPPGSGMFSEVYLYEEQMEADLHAIVRHSFLDPFGGIEANEQIRSGQPLSDAHFQSFIYQTLCGLKVCLIYIFWVQQKADSSTSTLQKFYTEI